MIFSLGLVTTQACVVPVFRYALENWPADTMEVAVFSPTADSGKHRALLDHVKSLQEYQGGTVNVNFWEFDPASQMPDWAMDVWKTESTKANGQPWVVLVDNNGRQGPRVLDNGPLTAGTFASMFDSPARRQAVGAILSGKAWSWIIVSADPAERKELEEKIASALAEVRKHVEFPSHEEMMNDPARPARPMSPLPLSLDTGVFHIDPTDPKEKGFLAQIADPAKPDAKGPALYALFGKARVIGPLRDRDLLHESLTDLTFFLSGPCACQIKDMNPGFDVAVAAKWGDVIDNPGSTAGVGLANDPVLFPPPSVKPPGASDASGNAEGGNPPSARVAILATVACGLAIALLALAVMLRRKPIDP